MEQLFEAYDKKYLYERAHEAEEKISELEVRDWFNALGFTTHREALHGAKDEGDIYGIGGRIA